ncbi:MAG: hypothetical protein COU07_00105 [Candidatus Harrisonbacteria bacterium CG10_big_fil_rev_8_21_14_0_10_40_38]|uniref:Beta-xylosidase C-terminal Concanavalin A-like domain-containing protein n=1 Tax=Candidatus Harrisonbacteria bacterium CG10_big_fil_rev_8_21_14_0_10_40_38 TaxID=1974583 RepID=A0A2H0USD0_9BACT|nr:MAG: hypothetical protein COU07_00105 [Candidatus Harrisonbacteria bacterium CG10_big_fil_rev_8_21_14_0_10_40_38]
MSQLLKKKIFPILSILILVFLLGVFFSSTKSAKSFSEIIYNFDEDEVIEESFFENKSNSDYWWLRSGGELTIENGIGKTIQGDLQENSYWKERYSKTNPRDTDNGENPQNIFRILTRKSWTNTEQRVYFYISKINKSESIYRNESNGIHLFNRYIDSNNLYYTGIRVDGTAVIKKKQNGIYYTMAQNAVFKNNNPYSRDANPSLLPAHLWIGIRGEVNTNKDGTVSIKMYLDRNKTGNWVLVAEALDDGINYGGPVISKSGRGGIRTDFLDIFFDNYKFGIIQTNQTNQKVINN